MFLFLLLNYYILVFYQFNDLQNVFNYSQNKKKIKIQFLHLAFKQITVNKNERVKKYEKTKENTRIRATPMGVAIRGVIPITAKMAPQRQIIKL